MSKKHRKTFINTVALLGILSTVGTYAYFSDSVSVLNHIATGDINIDLNEYEIKDQKEILYENPKMILPGDIISKIPRITNLSEPCWVRAKITYGNSNEEIEGFSDEFLAEISDEWVKQGEYYYYTKILENARSIDLFRSVTIPSDWNETHADQKLSIGIKADAIQAANFKPDFSAKSPWGNTKIEKCIHETEGVVIEKKEQVDLLVEFSGEAHKLIAAPDDFFSNLSTAMPGDVFKDSIEISNTTDRECEILFSTGLEEQTEEQLELIRNLKLSIDMEGKNIYSGNLAAKELNQEISLGTFQTKEAGKMNFTIEIPAELNNAYALRTADVKWTFTVYENEIEPEASLKGTEDVKTGDHTPIIAILSTLLSGMGAFLYILFSKSRSPFRKHKRK